MPPPNVCEEQVYAKVFRELSRPLRDYLFYLSSDLKLSEDMVQDLFFKLWERCKDVPYEKARSFLFKVARNEFLTHVEKQKVRLRYKNSIKEKSDKEDPQYLLESAEFKAKLEDALNALPDTQREVFLMNRIQKMTYAEIADVLGVSQKAIEKRMSKALRKMRDLLHPVKDS